MIPPATEETITGLLPCVVPAEVEIFKVVVHVGVQAAGENVPDAPDGRPSTEKDAGWEVPETRVAVIEFDAD